MNKILLFPIILVIVLFNTTCRSDEKMLSKVTFEGYVYDSLGGKPAQDIWVELRACDGDSQDDQCESFHVGSAKTDISGRFYIHDNAARSGRYAVWVKGDNCGGLDNGCGTDWLKKNFSMIYLNKIP